MANSRQMIALLKSHVQRDDQEFLSIAMEVAAAEARQGHSQVAKIGQIVQRIFIALAARRATVVNEISA
jgi:hypothetical protein